MVSLRPPAPFRLIRAPLVAAVLAACLATAAGAQSLIRDAEIEYALDTLTAPLIAATGGAAGPVGVRVVNDDSLNAFVSDGRAVYVNAGLLLRLKTPEAMQAVIAHELAHITNGHITRRGINAQSAARSTALGVALGVAAAVLAQDGSVGIGIAAGSASAAQGVFFSHTREEESAADRSGMRFLARAGIDPAAMGEVLSIFVGQEDALPSRQDAYVRSHPLSRDRLRAVEAYAELLGPTTSDHQAAAYWFDRAQAKLESYLRDPDYTFRRYPAADQSDAGHIARAVAYSKLGQADRAFGELDGLLATLPEDPFVWELKGWIALEANRIAPAAEAYGKAAELAPKEPQILAGYGRALLALNSAADDRRALEILQQARNRDGNDPRLMRDLATAYARTGQPAMASLNTADRFALLGDLKSAAVHAQRAEAGLPVGSPGWARAQDIIDAAKRAAQKKK